MSAAEEEWELRRNVQWRWSDSWWRNGGKRGTSVGEAARVGGGMEVEEERVMEEELVTEEEWEHRRNKQWRRNDCWMKMEAEEE